jgi:predicted nucleic acid-binding protein
MNVKEFSSEFWQYVMDSSALINIQRKRGVEYLKRRKGAILLPKQVEYEVALDPRVKKRDPLRQFVLKNPNIVTQFRDDEDEEFLKILRQPEIDDGEAAAIAIALKRGLPLVIDERNTKATGKARNHGIKVLKSEEFS